MTHVPLDEGLRLHGQGPREARRAVRLALDRHGKGAERAVRPASTRSGRGRRSTSSTRIRRPSPCAGSAARPSASSRSSSPRDAGAPAAASGRRRGPRPGRRALRRRQIRGGREGLSRGAGVPLAEVAELRARRRSRSSTRSRCSRRHAECVELAREALPQPARDGSGGERRGVRARLRSVPARGERRPRRRRRRVRESGARRPGRPEAPSGGRRPVGRVRPRSSRRGEDAKDEAGAKARRRANGSADLDAEAARVKTAEQRTALDPNRLSAYRSRRRDREGDPDARESRRRTFRRTTTRRPAWPTSTCS